MLASTIQFSNNKQTPTPNTHKGARRRHCPKLTTTQTMAEAPEPNNVHTPTPQAPTTLSTPTTRQAVLTQQTPKKRELDQCFHKNTRHHPLTTHGQERTAQPADPEKTCQAHGLPRKEVIQPHLPVRLPCYDLVLITDPTFDGSPHKG